LGHKKVFKSFKSQLNFCFEEEVTSLVGLFPLLESAVGIFGLAGLDRLLGLRIVTVLQNIVTLTDRSIFQVNLNAMSILNEIEIIVEKPRSSVSRPISKYYFLN
jgi:hypothetical protein